jgi:4-carboxymuconolactone decarboxylase
LRLTEISDTVLFDDVWRRQGLSPRDCSLITVASLVALYRSNELPFHLGKALENGVTRDEIIEMITHLTFYSGWPTANTAIGIARHVLAATRRNPDNRKEHQMQTRELDRSGLQVSAIGLGCMGISFSYATKLPNDEGVALIRRCGGARRDLLRHDRGLRPLYQRRGRRRSPATVPGPGRHRDQVRLRH